MPSPPVRAGVPSLVVSIAAALVAGFLGSGCFSESVRTAPFRERPDSVDAGRLTGPYDGRVVDATTGDPVSGALVYATWTFEAGYGLGRPAGYHETVVSTDANGRYDIPDLRDVQPDASSDALRGWRKGESRLTNFHLVIYKRGFVAYRSDRRFVDFGPRLDFAQRRHQIRLERWRADFSHARHLRYVGGGPALAALTAWESEAAAAELSGGGGDEARIATDFFAGPRERRVVAAQLLGEKTVIEMTEFDGSFETGPLGDEPDTSAYSSQHFQAVGLPQAYDLAIRLWTVGTAEAEKRYGALLEDLPGVEEMNEIGDRSLRAEEEGFYGLAILDARRGMVLLLTCGRALCSSPRTLADLARTAHDRLLELAPPPEDSQ